MTDTNKPNALDAAIEAAADKICDNDRDYSGAGLEQNIDIIRTHIMPVFEGLSAVIEYDSVAYEQLETELAKLKALVKKSMPVDDVHDCADDWNPRNRRECYECAKELTNNQYYCQNPECIAFKLREAYK